MPPVIALIPLAIAAVLASRRRKGGAVRASGHAMPWPIFQALTTDWAVRLNVPPLLLWAIATVESGRNPTAENHSPRGEAKGGAWGLFQVTLDTAKDLFKRFGGTLRKFPAGRRFDGEGRSLLDPGLNTLLGAFYLASLWREFQDFGATAAAFNQGPGTVRKILRRGGRLPADLPAGGRDYVAKASDVRDEILSRGMV